MIQDLWPFIFRLLQCDGVNFSHSLLTIMATMKVYSVWDSIKLLYYILKSIGYISFTVSGKIENGQIKTTVFDHASRTASIIVMVIMIYMNCINNFTLIKTGTLVIDITNYLANLFLVYNVLFSIVFIHLRRYQIWNIFKQFHKFDEEV